MKDLIARQNLLTECEVIIQGAKDTLNEVAEALKIIRDEKLWKEGYASFGEYCQKRWGFGKSWGYYLANPESKKLRNIRNVHSVDVDSISHLGHEPKDNSARVEKSCVQIGTPLLIEQPLNDPFLRIIAYTVPYNLATRLVKTIPKIGTTNHKEVIMSEETHWIWKVYKDGGKEHTFITTLFSEEDEVKKYYLNRFGVLIESAKLNHVIPYIEPEPLPVGNGPYWGLVDGKNLTRWVAHVKGCQIQQWWETGTEAQEVHDKMLQFYGACDKVVITV